MPKRTLVFFFSLLLILAPIICNAYPDFIGYGYSSCLSCHYNGAGGGPITDYGRAVWASEIAGKWLWPSRSDDELGEASGFLGSSKKLSEGVPWLKPYVKYRGLYYHTDGLRSDGTGKFIQMQADLGTTIVPSDESKWLFSGGIGWVPKPQGANPSRPAESRTIISREYYARYEANERNWLYFGFLDKVFGLRIPDHTAANRRLTGNTQNDQVHSVMLLHTTEKSGDLFVQLSAGNLTQDSALQERGAGVMKEFEMNEHTNLGLSAWLTKNDYVTKAKTSTHIRVGIPKGHSVLAEVGFVQNRGLSGTVRNDLYTYAEAMMNISRGIFLTSVAESSNQGLNSSSTQDLRWALGILVFPIQRFEFRSQVQFLRSIDARSSNPDSQVFNAQLHMSL